MHGYGTAPHCAWVLEYGSVHANVAAVAPIIPLPDRHVVGFPRVCALSICTSTTGNRDYGAVAAEPSVCTAHRITLSLVPRAVAGMRSTRRCAYR